MRTLLCNLTFQRTFARTVFFLRIYLYMGSKFCTRAAKGGALVSSYFEGGFCLFVFSSEKHVISYQHCFFSIVFFLRVPLSLGVSFPGLHI